jgi:anti-sigma factor RsiW
MNTQSSKEQEHLEVQSLLPWQASGALSASEQALVRRHLEECADCRADLALDQRLRAAEPAPPAGLDPERALGRMMARVDALPAQTPAPAPLSRLRAAFAGGGWRNWALAAQFAVIAGLAIAWMQPPPPDSAYRALGSGDAAAPELIVVFKPDARLSEVQHLLRSTGGRIVDGPTVTGAYLLDVEEQQAGSLLAALRADPSVQLAEPLNPGARP